MFKKITLATLSTLFFLGCTHTEGDISNVNEICLDDERAKTALKSLEDIVDKIQRGQTDISANTILIAKSCKKEVYERNGYQIKIFKDRASDLVHGTVQAKKDTPKNPSACLKRFEDQVKRSSYKPALLAISESKRVLKEAYADDGFGPLRWLMCSDERAIRNVKDQIKAVHELIHELDFKREKHWCTFDVISNQERCLDLDERLPYAGVVQLKMQASNKSLEQLLVNIQDVYFNKEREEAYTKIFDELLAYTVETGFHLALKNKLGTSAIYNDHGIRDLNFLPMFMTYSAVYLWKTKRKDPKLYQEFFVDTSTRKQIDQILAQSEEAYGQWRAYTRKHDADQNGDQQKVEEGFYAEYKATIKELM